MHTVEEITLVPPKIYRVMLENGCSVTIQVMEDQSTVSLSISTVSGECQVPVDAGHLADIASALGAIADAVPEPVTPE